jgi:hypothetical protein
MNGIIPLTHVRQALEPVADDLPELADRQRERETLVQ